PEISRQMSKFIAPKPQPAGPARNAQAGEWLLLDPLDMGKVLAEDLERQLQGAKSAQRIGVFQDFPQRIRVAGARANLGRWETLRDGTRLWSVRIYSPEAVAQRIHFATLDLPRGAQVVVYNASYPEEAYGPYTAPYPGESDLWAASCFSDAVAVECAVPAGVPVEPVRIVLDQTAHIYADFATLPWGKALNEAGSCNLDVACYPDWQETSWGVGGIGSITRGTGVLWCTGSLIADSVPETEIPYFLTAEHCVGTAQEASALEFYWLWQRETCGGALLPVYSVPRTTGGADFMVSSPAPSGSDFTLLRLRNQPPEGLTYLGWTTVAPPIDTSVTCIHHPSGDYKRISFGDLITGAAYPATVHRVGWNEGTTEKGSSGSPLMLTDTQQVIGQLWRGNASCSMPREAGGWDEFGRFDVTYPLAAPWLGPIEPAGPADINKDGFLDAVDIQLVINAALGVPVDPDFEPNVSGDPDGQVNAVDIQLVINAALGI
ncbi:MAG TPA: trypsin-like peptidase domain-containing protein, partial [Candidatus Hydrogenedentes bacterium]|nr:trypsin-like peptidase domain-containing protein [Candidatus Hydrogenedentota bacterium]